MNPDLIVVGGGWAGCAASVEAARHGWSVLLLEQAHQLGGRASSFVHGPSGEELDNGQHLFLGAYEHCLRLLEALGTRDWVRFDPALRVEFLDQGVLKPFAGRGLPGALDLVTALFTSPYLSPAEKRQALALGLRKPLDLFAARFGRLRRGLASLSVAQWLAQAGQGPAITTKLWEPLCLAALNARPAQARASEFVAVLAQGFLRGGATAALGTATAPLSRLLKPVGLYLKDRQGEAFAQAAVESVRQAEGGFEVQIRGEAVRSAPRLILALPAALSARLLGPELSSSLGLAAPATQSASPIVSVLLWHRTGFLPTDRLAFTAPQGQPDFHWAFRLSPGHEGLHRSAYVASAADSLAGLDNEAIREKLYAQLQGALPGFDPASVSAAQVLKERRATPLFAPQGPDRLPQRTQLAGLGLAGDWTETGLPATIEGACKSGVLAAQDLLNA